MPAPSAKASMMATFRPRHTNAGTDSWASPRTTANPYVMIQMVRGVVTTGTSALERAEDTLVPYVDMPFSSVPPTEVNRPLIVHPCPTDAGSARSGRPPSYDASP